MGVRAFFCSSRKELQINFVRRGQIALLILKIKQESDPPSRDELLCSLFIIKHDRVVVK